jgi:uncharacterized protein (DUF427 family)
MTTISERSQLRVEPSPKWVRAFLGGVAVVDSTRAHLVWERPYPTYYFPVEDVRTDLLDPSVYRHLEPGPAGLPDLVTVEWEAMDHWFEEDEEVYVHPRSPYARVDVLPSSRHVQVVVDGEVIAESHRPVLLFETGLPTRYYFRKTDVRMDLLTPTDTQSRCPYKGIARYWSVNGDRRHKDLAWGYDFPLPESIRIAGHVAFYNHRVELYIDGVLQD